MKFVDKLFILDAKHLISFERSLEELIGRTNKNCYCNTSLSRAPKLGATCNNPMRIGTVVGRQLQYLSGSGLTLELLGTTFVLGPHAGAPRVTLLFCIRPKLDGTW
jgi:hypothetical protein